MSGKSGKQQAEVQEVEIIELTEDDGETFCIVGASMPIAPRPERSQVDSSHD